MCVRTESQTSIRCYPKSVSLSSAALIKLLFYFSVRLASNSSLDSSSNCWQETAVMWYGEHHSWKSCVDLARSVGVFSSPRASQLHAFFFTEDSGALLPGIKSDTHSNRTVSTLTGPHTFPLRAASQDRFPETIPQEDSSLPDSSLPN